MIPKVSVIIPCYNLGEYLDETVNSVLSQTFQDLEIIIVDDGSTDQLTKTLLSQYNKPKTRVLTTRNQGLPEARNNGIRISSGEYICCLDADDKYHPEFLAKTVSILDQDITGALGFVTTWVRAFGDKDSISTSLEFDPWQEAVCNEIHVASLFRRECWEIVGGYNPNMAGGYEDWNFWLSIVAEGYRWVSIKEPLFFYRVKPHSMIKDSDKRRVELYRQIIRNNKRFFSENCEDILTKFMEILSKEQAFGAQLHENHVQLTMEYKRIKQEHRELEEKYIVLNQEYLVLEQSKAVRFARAIRKYPLLRSILSSGFRNLERLHTALAR